MPKKAKSKAKSKAKLNIKKFKKGRRAAPPKRQKVAVSIPALEAAATKSSRLRCQARSRRSGMKRRRGSNVCSDADAARQEVTKLEAAAKKAKRDAAKSAAAVKEANNRAAKLDALARKAREDLLHPVERVRTQTSADR